MMVQTKNSLMKKVGVIAELKEAYQSSDSEKNFNFISRFMCFASLPHVETNKKVYERITTFGNIPVKLHIYSPHGIPYGIWARRILSLICTEVIHKKNRSINLGDTQAKFFKKVSSAEILMTGGKNGALRHLKEQAKRIFSASLYIECLEKKSWAFSNSVFAEKGVLFWESTDNEKWEGQITLSETMFSDITKYAVPLEYGAVTKLNSFTFDVYIWLRWRAFFSKKNISISWGSLFQQFGHGYKQDAQGKSNFKRNFMISLKTACSILSLRFFYNKKTITIYFEP